MVLDGDVFDVPIRKDIVHRVVRWQLAKRQQVRITQYVFTWPSLMEFLD
jgi:ribosomal protein L4